MQTLRRPWFVVSVGVIALLAFGATTARAVIEKAVKLADVIHDNTYIFVAKIEKVLPDKPGMILTATDDLKGKAPFRRLAINLTGDKEKDTPKLLERVAADLPVVMFVVEQDNKTLLLFVYSNGTWFQVIGSPDGENFRWAFTHCCPELRKTFKGTTAELRQVVDDALSGKHKPPPLDSKEPPGLGPKVEKSE